jgi:site-specific recombinase XerD
LHFARWWKRADFAALNEARLLDYVRHQLEQHPKPTAQTINHRLTVLHCIYRFRYQREISGAARYIKHTYRTRSPLGYGRARTALAGFRVKEPRRVVVPLNSAQVEKFWRSFRSFRDLAMIALMLLDGLRSREVIDLLLEDLQLTQTQLRVRGKGGKERLLPLPKEAITALQNYLRLVRPATAAPQLFVCLKGKSRGQAMTPAGLRSLFRHHRKKSEVPQANPHRLRHTYASDMVRAGISLPALMKLMGHSQIFTTMRYVELSPHDVWHEYAKAVQNRARLAAQSQP